MNKKYILPVAFSAVLASASYAQTVTFGDENVDGNDWNELWATETGAARDASVTLNDLDVTFTLTTTSNDRALRASNDGVRFGINGGDANVAVDAGGSEYLTFTLSLSGTEVSQIGSVTFSTVTLANVDATETFSILDADSNTVSLDGRNGTDLTYGDAGEFDGLTITDSDPSGGVSWSFRFTPTSGDFSIDQVNVTYSQIPEPGTFALIAGSAALGLIALRRRR